MSYYLFLLLLFVLLARPQDFIPAFGAVRPALTMTVLATVTTLPKISGRLGRIAGASVSRRYLFFFLMMVMSIPLAYHRRVAFNFVVLVYLSNIILYLLFLVHVDSLKKLQSAMLTVAASTCFYAVYSVRSGGFRGGRFAAGAMFDPNGLAYYFLSLMPLSIWLLLGSVRIWSRMFAVVVICLSTGIVLLTGSRGGMLGLLAVGAMILLQKWPGVSRSSKGLLILLPLVALAFSRGSIKVDRFLSIAHVGTDYNVTDKSGRLAIWMEGLELLLKNPVTGVGVQCFPQAIGEKRHEEGELPKWQGAHNFLVQILVEVGVVGFGAFCAAILGSLRNLSGCLSHARADAEGRELGLIAASVQVAFTGALVTAFFLNEGYSVLFTLYFALSCSVGMLCEERASSRSGIGQEQ